MSSLYVHIETDGLINTKTGTYPQLIALSWAQSASAVTTTCISGRKNAAERFNGISAAEIAAGSDISRVLTAFSAQIATASDIRGFKLDSFILPVLINEAKTALPALAAALARKKAENVGKDAKVGLYQWISAQTGAKIEPTNYKAKLTAIINAHLGVKPQKEYLRVSFAEREAAKALGAQWDPEMKKWYAGERLDTETRQKLIFRWGVGAENFAGLVRAEAERQKKMKETGDERYIL
jgi:hypothetical protein